MAFSSSSVLIYDNASNTVVSFETNQSTPYSVTVGAAYEGVTLDYVVSRAGYTKSLGQFVGGGAISLSTTPVQRTDPDGTPAYTGTTSANIAVSFTFTPSLRCFIDIGDASVSSQTIVDEIEDALETENGCRFLAETGGATCLQAVLAGQTYLLLGANYRLRRASAGDVNAAVDAYVISADGIPLDGTNGGVQFLTAQDIASEVWGALTSDHAVTGSFGQLIKDYLNASIADILTDTGTTIPAQIAALNDFDPATDAVTVGAINNNVITSSTIAANALNDSAFTTGYFNAINSEVDTALTDYDAPTKAELDTAQAAIQADITALNDIAASDVVAAINADPVNVNIKYVNNIEVKGVGSEEDPWNPV